MTNNYTITRPLPAHLIHTNRAVKSLEEMQRFTDAICEGTERTFADVVCHLTNGDTILVQNILFDGVEGEKGGNVGFEDSDENLFYVPGVLFWEYV